MVSIEFLKKIALLNGLTDDEITRIAQICRERVVNRDDVIVEENAPSDAMYIIHEGMVEVLLEPGKVTPEALAAPAPTPLLALGRGQVFGEMGLVDSGARSATVRCAADNTRLFAIGRDDFLHLCEEDTRIGYVVMRNIARDLSFKLRVRNLAWK
ncbi:MAG: cyclic nucleotide-binding domain-containing protein [Anaerolineae bacterium]|jgi:CRP-like cAMP-binding protein|nr:cyclic nucleotide-binding domain-containing protein [Anaerolineae bacterium]MDH7473708.1 cyclic nucleotide-binding domain-containing protein [Anaerolineae bacterium]